MPGLGAKNTPLEESALQSPTFVIPKYRISFGKDLTLEWFPPAGSPQLALALSYHFPKQNSLTGKMRIAVHLFLRTTTNWPEQARHHTTSLSTKKLTPIGEKDKGGEENISQNPETPTITPRVGVGAQTKSLVHSAQLIDVAQVREPILDIAPPFPGIEEIIWKADTGEEIQLQPKKRQYTETERLEVSNNRGNVCKEHRQKKQKCSPLTCPRNKHFLRNNSETQDRTYREPKNTGEGLQENRMELERDCSNNHGNYMQKFTPPEISEIQKQPVKQILLGDMSYVNSLGFTSSGNASLNSTEIEPTEDANIFSRRKRVPYTRTKRGSATESEKTSRDKLNLLSPAASTSAAQSPKSEKSPPVSFFDDAWVDSPYRVDDDQESNSEYKIEAPAPYGKGVFCRREVDVEPSFEERSADGSRVRREVVERGVRKSILDISRRRSYYAPPGEQYGLERGYDNFEQRTTTRRHDSATSSEKVNPEMLNMPRTNTTGKARGVMSYNSRYHDTDFYVRGGNTYEIRDRICDKTEDDAAVNDGVQNLSVLFGATSLESKKASN